EPLGVSATARVAAVLGRRLAVGVAVAAVIRASAARGKDQGGGRGSRDEPGDAPNLHVPPQGGGPTASLGPTVESAPGTSRPAQVDANCNPGRAGPCQPPPDRRCIRYRFVTAVTLSIRLRMPWSDAVPGRSGADRELLSTHPDTRIRTAAARARIGPPRTPWRDHPRTGRRHVPDGALFAFALTLAAGLSTVLGAGFALGR